MAGRDFGEVSGKNFFWESRKVVLLLASSFQRKLVIPSLSTTHIPSWSFCFPQPSDSPRRTRDILLFLPEPRRGWYKGNIFCTITFLIFIYSDSCVLCVYLRFRLFRLSGHTFVKKNRPKDEMPKISNSDLSFSPQDDRKCRKRVTSEVDSRLEQLSSSWKDLTNSRRKSTKEPFDLAWDLWRGGMVK